MSHFYESMLREMRDAAGDAGEFYTPRPVIRFVVGRIDPQPGEIIMDPATGTGGFLVEAWDHLVPRAKTARLRQKIKGSLRGFEKKPMPYLLGQMNLMLHGVDAPQITRGNALRYKLTEQRNTGVDVVITNPPFGGEEEAGIKEYFPSDLRTSETSWLFLESVMARVSKSKTGRAAANRLSLNAFLTPDTRVTRVVSESQYPNLGLLNNGRGVFRKQPILGTETKYVYLHPVSAGQLIYSKLFGWEGSVALVPDEFDGCYVSGEFPHFDIDNNVIEPRYLAHLVRSASFQGQLAVASTGMGQPRHRVNVHRFLSIEVDLPSTRIQRQMARRLDQVDYIEKLARERAALADALPNAARNEVFAKLTE
jgi:hypothetical protein